VHRKNKKAQIIFL